jgi:hypothetical protein
MFYASDAVMGASGPAGRIPIPGLKRPKMSLKIHLDRRLLILTFGDAMVHDPKKGELGFLVAQAGHQLNVLGCLWVYHRGLISNLQKKADYFLSTGLNHQRIC